jgi:radical SAM protein with 4Fe4S-binding SPASM domain
MNNQNKTQFQLFPGVIKEEGVRNVSYIDISRGKVFHLSKEEIAAQAPETFERQLVDANLGCYVPAGHDLPDFYQAPVKITFTERLTVMVQENLDYLSYVTHEIEQVFLFKRDYDEAAAMEEDERAVVKVRKFDPDKCPFTPDFDGEPPFNPYDYNYNKLYNPCWGMTMAIDQEGIVKPCLWSDIELGHIQKEGFFPLIEKLEPYWHLTKGKIDTCKDCEYKFICPDCRAGARKQSGCLTGKTAGCDYNPNTSSINNEH